MARRGRCRRRRAGPTGRAVQHRRTFAALAGSGITCPPVEAALLVTYFSYLEAHRRRAGSWRPDIDRSALASDRRGPVPAGTTERLRGHRGPRFTGGRRGFTAP